jgi:hypothetical protein
LSPSKNLDFAGVLDPPGKRLCTGFVYRKQEGTDCWPRRLPSVIMPTDVEERGMPAQQTSASFGKRKVK